MKSDDIIVVGLLSDETFIKRFKQIRRVLSADGICVTIPAACGLGGGVTPKIILIDED